MSLPGEGLTDKAAVDAICSDDGNNVRSGLHGREPSRPSVSDSTPCGGEQKHGTASRRGENPKADGSEPRDEDAALAQELLAFRFLLLERPPQVNVARLREALQEAADALAARLRGAQR